MSTPLPWSMQQLFRQQSGHRYPSAALRVFRTLSGQAGEGWLATWSGGIVFLGRHPETATQRLRFDWSDVTGLEIYEQPFSAEICLETTDEAWRLPFALRDRPLAERLRSQRPPPDAAMNSPPPMPATPPPLLKTPPPLPKKAKRKALKTFARPHERKYLPNVVYFAAAMLAMAHADNVMSDSELTTISRIFEQRECLAQGRRVLDSCTLEELFQTIATMFTPEQKKCLLANLLDLAAADGTTAPQEIALLTQCRHILQIPDTLWLWLEDANRIKNDLSVFSY